VLGCIAAAIEFGSAEELALATAVGGGAAAPNADDPDADALGAADTAGAVRKSTTSWIDVRVSRLYPFTTPTAYIENILLSVVIDFAKSLSDRNETGWIPSIVSIGPSIPCPFIIVMKS